MATFHALNIEYDTTVESEVDDTKELQIEDALKLYQTALKYHAEGPRSFEKAADAYTALFESEVFKYPESQSELRRQETYADIPEYDELLLQDTMDSGVAPIAAPGDTAPNTLPQILHLAYKNHGEFLLDVLQHRVKEHLTQNNDPEDTRKQVQAAAKIPLGYIAEALDKDDADLDLWRSAASVSQLVGSARLERYCLEAVLDGDEDGFDSFLTLPGIDQAFAAEQLRNIVGKLEDDLSSSTAPLSLLKRQKLSRECGKMLDPFSSIPKPKFEDATYSRAGMAGRRSIRRMVPLSRLDWIAVGDAILSQLTMENAGNAGFVPGAAIGFQPPAATVPSTSASIPIRNFPSSSGKESSTAGNPPPTPKSLAVGQQTTDDGLPKPIEDQPVESADNEVDMDAQIDEVEDRQEEPEQFREAATDGVTTRKRSSASAELPENAEGGRVRSKRIRARETLDGNHTIAIGDIDTVKHLEAALQQYQDADDWLFSCMANIFEPLKVDGLGSLFTLRSLASPLSSSAKNVEEEESLATAIRDLLDMLQNCSQEKASVFMNGESVDHLASAPIEYSLTSFLGVKPDDKRTLSKPLLDVSEGVNAFTEIVNSKWTYSKEAAWLWLVAFLKGGGFPNSNADLPSSYLRHRWPEDLKKSIVQVAVHADEYVYEKLSEFILQVDRTMAKANCEGTRHQCTPEDLSLIEMTQTLFEIHLDVFKRFRHPNSGIESSTQAAQQYRLERWSALANTAVNLRESSIDSVYDDLAIRHIWATAFHISAIDDLPQSHIVAVMHDLKELLTSSGSPCIQLQNNAVMPEISAGAAEQELSEINMRDFFRKVFSHDEQDPVAVIESLEPILTLEYDHNNTSGGDMNAVSSVGHEDKSIPESPSLSISPLHEVSKFLAKGSITLRLSLWQRLRMAYQAIDHIPKVISCHLRSLEILVNEFTRPSYHSIPKESRSFLLLRWLQIADDLLQRILTLLKGMQDPFEYVDMDHLRTSLNALQTLSRLFYAFNIYEDHIRTNQLPTPTMDGRGKQALLYLISKMYELQIRSWVLQYLLLKEAISQEPESFPTPAENRLEFLRTVHYSLGIRGICNRADKALLKLERDELLELSDLDTSDLEMCQVLLDLYGLKLSPHPVELVDHRCADVEQLTRGRANKLLGFVMAQAAKVPLKDLPKTELKASIDKVHGFLGMAKQKMTEDMQLNRRILQQFLKSPLSPLALFSALRGVLELPVRSIPDQDAPIAAKGWHSLMANIALCKFKSQKRLQPGPTEDLNIAIAFFLQDLEYSADRWESWYRLAQCHDLQLEECVSWTAEKMNTQSQDIQQFQRSAIHCYAMAVSTAIQTAENTRDNKGILADLFYEFGLRMYSSSREPFALRAFQFRDLEEKWFSGQMAGQDMYKRPPCRPLQLYTCWKIAAYLFRQSLTLNSESWMTHFMLGKCLWKMYSANEATRGSQKAPSMLDIVAAFRNSIETLPTRKNKEPILEPHYKLVSIVHKLVQRKDLEPEKAGSILQESTRYAHKAMPPKDFDGWNPFILKVIGELKSTDKANWHHRIIARAAHIVYEDSNGDMLGAMGAKHELTQQMFTKTMQIQVWRPDNERPGRHFVYTSRYLRFFMRLLVQLGDRTNLELLVRRLRRKPQEFYDHVKLWQETVLIYLKLLRRTGKIPEGHEDHVFKSLNHDEFSAKSERLEAWCHAATTQSAILDTLKEAIEMKRMNMGLMKVTLIDDLVCDTYAKLYEDIVPSLSGNAKPAAQSEALQQQTNSTGIAGSSSGTTPFQSQVAPQTQLGQLAAEPSINNKTRNKGVGRREIMRKAELCVNRPVAATIASIPARAPVAASQPIGQTVQVVISRVSHLAAGIGDQASIASGAAESTAPSQRGSIYGSAFGDDEGDSGSELSEPPEDLEGDEMDFDEIKDDHPVEPPAPMFPNLVRKKTDDATGSAEPRSALSSPVVEQKPGHREKSARQVGHAESGEAKSEGMAKGGSGTEKADNDGDVEMAGGA